MILDKSRLTVNKAGLRTEYIYNYPSDDKKILITLIVVQFTDNVTYIVDKEVNDLQGNVITKSEDTIFKTDDLKEAWEKFEDLFEETQEQENPQQGGQEPEVQVLMVTVEKNGSSFVFLLKQDNTQELVLEMNIDNYDIQNTKPKFAELDFTNDPNVSEPFNTKWNLALVDDVKYENASADSTTFIVALESVNQPGQESGQPGEQSETEQGDKQGEEGDKQGDKKDQSDKGDQEDKSDKQGDKSDKQGDDKGESGDDKGESGDDKGESGDDKGEPGTEQPKPRGSDELKTSEGETKGTVQKVDYKGVISQLAKETDLSPDDIESSLRTERIFDSFLTLNNVNVNELKNKFNASDLTRNQFVKQIVSDFKNI